MLAAFRGHAIIALSSFLTILASAYLAPGSFAFQAWPYAVFLALGLTVAASVVFYVLAVLLDLFRVESPGAILQTVLGTVAGSAAIYLAHRAMPDTVMLEGMADCLTFALANTMLVWLIAFLTGSLKPGLHLLPRWRDK